MRYTLLELTQRVLESMTSDEVDNISDTEESYAVANIIKECYFDIIGRYSPPEQSDVFQLIASGDSNVPTIMTLPEEALDLQRVMYTNVDDTGATSLYDVNFLEFNKFIEWVGSLNEDADNVGSLQYPNRIGQVMTFKFQNDRNPVWYTSFNDHDIIFDAFDITQGATLVGAKTFCYGNLSPDWTMSNDFIPNLDLQQVQLLLQAAKAQASVEIRQVENPKAERKERRNEILAQKTKRAVDKRPERFKYLGYGR